MATSSVWFKSRSRRSSVTVVMSGEVVMISALVFVIVLFAPPTRADAVSDFDSSWVGESAFLNVIPGQTFQFQVSS